MIFSIILADEIQCFQTVYKKEKKNLIILARKFKIFKKIMNLFGISRSYFFNGRLSQIQLRNLGLGCDGVNVRISKKRLESIIILAWKFKWDIPQWAGVLVDKRLDRPKSSWLNFFNFVPEIEMLRSEGLFGKLGVIWK